MVYPPYKFTGKEEDPETGLIYFGARYYDAAVGIWHGVDPLADHPNQVDKSPYIYTWNNPIVLNDPDGRCPTCPDETYVPISDHVYDAKVGDVTSNGWEAIQVHKNDKTGFKGALYRGTHEGKTEYIYATAGTQDITKDGVQDIMQLYGNSEQYSQSVDGAKQLSKEFEGVSFTGHSLGGGLASANALAVEGKAVTFNAAAVSDATKTNLGLNNKVANISAYIIEGEALHYLQSTFLDQRAEGNIVMLPSPVDYGFRNPSILVGLKAYFGGAMAKRLANHSMNVVTKQFSKR